LQNIVRANDRKKKDKELFTPFARPFTGFDMLLAAISVYHKGGKDFVTEKCGHYMENWRRCFAQNAAQDQPGITASSSSSSASSAAASNGGGGGGSPQAMGGAGAGGSTTNPKS